MLIGVRGICDMLVGVRGISYMGVCNELPPECSNLGVPAAEVCVCVCVYICMHTCMCGMPTAG